MSTERRIHFGLLFAALAVTGWVFLGHRSTAPAAMEGAPVVSTHAALSPASLVPHGPAFLLTADVHQLEQAPLGVFLVQRVVHAGATQLTAQCGFDPLARLDQLALAVPSAATIGDQEHPEDFGIVATGHFSAAEIMHCASGAIAAHRGEPMQTKLGSFSSVRDRQRTGGEIAAREGLLLVSGGSYFRDLLDAAEGRAPKLDRPDARDARHSALRSALGPAPLVASWVLGEGWFDRVAGGAGNAQLSPLGKLRDVGARVDVGGALHLAVILECEDSAGALEVSKMLGDLRGSLNALPVDPALIGTAQRVTVSQTGARLTLSLELAQAELAPLLDLLLGPA